MPTPNRHPQRGNVLVLTMFALIPLLGFLGLAVDLGYMFNYKLRAQIAADAAALAAALEPYTAGDLSKNTAAALDIARSNDFDGVDAKVAANGCDAPNNNKICIAVETPPLVGAFVGSAEGEAYEVDLRQNLPTYFMSAVGVTSFPIHVRAVAKSKSAVLPCFTVGDTTIASNTRVDGPDCQLYFTGSLSGDNQYIKASATNLDTDVYTIFKETDYDENMLLPDAPAPTFPSFNRANGSVDPQCSEDAECTNSSINSRCYRNLIIKNSCTLNAGQYKITGSVTFEQSAKATGEGIIFLLKAGSTITFSGKMNLSSGATGYPDYILWAERPGSTTKIIEMSSDKTSGSGELTKTNGNLAFTHDPGTGDDRLLLVGVITGATSMGNDAPQISGVKFKNQAMEIIGTELNDPLPVRAYLFKMVNPPSGSGSVIVSASGPDARNLTAPIIAWAISYKNVSQTMLPKNVTGTGVITITASDIASAPDQKIFGIVGVDDLVSIISSDGQDSIGTLAKNSISGAISTKPGAINASMRWSWASSKNAALVAVSLMGTGGIIIDQNAKALDNEKPMISGHIYAPYVPFYLAGQFEIKPGSGLASKPGLVE